MTAKLTVAMRRELKSIARDGKPSNPYEWSHAPSGLWFHAREKALTALLARGLIFDDPTRIARYSLTSAGREALRDEIRNQDMEDTLRGQS